MVDINKENNVDNQVVSEAQTDDTSPEQTVAESATAEQSVEGNKVVEEQADNRQADNQQADNRQDDDASQEEADEYVKHVQNWRALRAKAEQAEKERDEALARLSQQKKETPRENEPDFNLNDDDLTEGKHLKYYQQQNEKRMADLENRLIENQLKSNFPDFDEVVNKDTLGMLRDTDPELAESLAYNPNMYSKAVAAYKSIKRYNLDEASARGSSTRGSSHKYDKEKKKVNSNISKPRPVNSLAPQQGESPLSRANAFAGEFTEEDKLRTWKEMQEIINSG